MMKRFVHELRYSRKITHQNVIRIYDFLYVRGNYAISMEYFPSHTLGGEIVNEKPIVPEARDTLRDGHLHRHGRGAPGRASCIATSSLPTSSSTTKACSRSWTSASPPRHREGDTQLTQARAT